MTSEQKAICNFHKIVLIGSQYNETRQINNWQNTKEKKIPKTFFHLIMLNDITSKKC